MKTWKNISFKPYLLKVQFKHENTCLKHDFMKISSPTVILTVIVQCSFPGALAPCELKLWPRLHQWAKNTRVLIETPLGRCSKLLVDWVLGPMAGEMWVNRVAVVMIPVRPGTLTTATRVTQHTPTFGPRTQSTGNRGTTPGGCQQTPNAFNHRSNLGQSLSSLGPWHQRTTTTQILWSDVGHG